MCKVNLSLEVVNDLILNARKDLCDEVLSNNEFYESKEQVYAKARVIALQDVYNTLVAIERCKL